MRILYFDTFSDKVASTTVTTLDELFDMTAFPVIVDDEISDITRAKIVRWLSFLTSDCGACVSLSQVEKNTLPIDPAELPSFDQFIKDYQFEAFDGPVQLPLNPSVSTLDPRDWAMRCPTIHDVTYWHDAMVASGVKEWPF